MATLEDRIEAARQVVRGFDIGEEWDAVIDDGVPPELAALARELVGGYRRADMTDWNMFLTVEEAVDAARAR